MNAFGGSWPARGGRLAGRPPVRRRPGGSPAPSTITAVGDGEGKVTVLAWPGYVEDGTTSPDVDWVTSFETETGCQVTVQTFGTSDEAFTLFQTNPSRIRRHLGVGRRDAAPGRAVTSSSRSTST